MQKLTCEVCGGVDLVKEGEYFVCQFCGEKYASSDIRNMIGTVRIDNVDKLEKLYQLARRAKEDKSAANAAKFYNMILREDPTSWEATFYEAYYLCVESSLENLEFRTVALSKGIESVLKLIKEQINGNEDREKAVTEIAVACLELVESLYERTMSYRLGLGSISKGLDKFRSSLCRQAVVELAYILGNAIERQFPDNEKMIKLTVTAWSTGVMTSTLFSDSIWGTANNEVERKKIQVNTEKIRSYDPSYTLQGTTSGGGCYVATCVYGSYDCPEVWTLRRYRDFCLAKNGFGRSAVKIYYAVSPTIVKWFGEKNTFKVMFKTILNFLVSNLHTRGYEDSAYEDQAW